MANIGVRADLEGRGVDVGWNDANKTIIVGGNEYNPSDYGFSNVGGKLVGSQEGIDKLWGDYSGYGNSQNTTTTPTQSSTTSGIWGNIISTATSAANAINQNAQTNNTPLQQTPQVPLNNTPVNPPQTQQNDTNTPSGNTGVPVSTTTNNNAVPSGGTSGAKTNPPKDYTKSNKEEQNIGLRDAITSIGSTVGWDDQKKQIIIDGKGYDVSNFYNDNGTLKGSADQVAYLISQATGKSVLRHEADKLGITLSDYNPQTNTIKVNGIEVSANGLTNVGGRLIGDKNTVEQIIKAGQSAQQNGSQTNVKTPVAQTKDDTVIPNDDKKPIRELITKIPNTQIGYDESNKMPTVTMIDANGNKSTRFLDTSDFEMVNGQNIATQEQLQNAVNKAKLGWNPVKGTFEGTQQPVNANALLESIGIENVYYDQASKKFVSSDGKFSFEGGTVATFKTNNGDVAMIDPKSAKLLQDSAKQYWDKLASDEQLKMQEEERKKKEELRKPVDDELNRLKEEMLGLQNELKMKMEQDKVNKDAIQGIKDLISKEFTWDPNTDPGLKVALNFAQRKVMEEMNARGLLNSTITPDNINLAYGELIPQYRKLAYEEYSNSMQMKMNGLKSIVDINNAEWEKMFKFTELAMTNSKDLSSATLKNIADVNKTYVDLKSNEIEARKLDLQEQKQYEDQQIQLSDKLGYATPYIQKKYGIPADQPFGQHFLEVVKNSNELNKIEANKIKEMEVNREDAANKLKNIIAEKDYADKQDRIKNVATAMVWKELNNSVLIGGVEGRKYWNKFLAEANKDGNLVQYVDPRSWNEMANVWNDTDKTDLQREQMLNDLKIDWARINQGYAELELRKTDQELRKSDQALGWANLGQRQAEFDYNKNYAAMRDNIDDNDKYVNALTKDLYDRFTSEKTTKNIFTGATNKVSTRSPEQQKALDREIDNLAKTKRDGTYVPEGNIPANERLVPDDLINKIRSQVGALSNNPLKKD